MPAEHSIPESSFTPHADYCGGGDCGNSDRRLLLPVVPQSISADPRHLLWQEQSGRVHLIGEIQQANCDRSSEADEAKRALGDTVMTLHTTVRNFTRPNDHWIGS